MTDTAIRFPSSRVAARKAIGDSGEKQKLIRTIARKGFRNISNSVSVSEREIAR
jgi:DNA-binding winged helix-turn-helix (wHTH) protein